MPPGRPKGSTNKKREEQMVLDNVPRIAKNSIGVCSPCKHLNVDERDYYCCSCGKKYTKQSGNFSASPSIFFIGNGGFLPICKKCMAFFEVEYSRELGSSDEGVRRLAAHWDYYVSDEIIGMSRKINKNQPRITTLVSKNFGMSQFAGKTYDSYLQELVDTKIETIEDVKDVKNNKITQKTIKFWGTGYTESDYLYLNDKYDDWTSRHECKTKAQESIFQKICLMELQITRAIQSGDKVEGLMKAYNDLLGSANVKPVQTNDNSLADQNSFGTLIQKWENERPIPEPDPEWKDVDGVIKYITTWFLGHLTKMMNIKNRYSAVYEDEISKYTVKKPQYEDDPDALFEGILGGDENIDG